MSSGSGGGGATHGASGRILAHAHSRSGNRSEAGVFIGFGFLGDRRLIRVGLLLRGERGFDLGLGVAQLRRQTADVVTGEEYQQHRGKDSSHFDPHDQ